MHLFLVKKEIISLNLFVQYSIIQLDCYMSLNRRYITLKTCHTRQAAHKLTAVLKHTALATSNLSSLICPISAENHSDLLVMQMASSNSPPMYIGLGMFAAFSWTLFHRLLSSTFVGRARSLNNFRTSSTEWMNVSMRLVTLCIGADMIDSVSF